MIEITILDNTYQLQDGITVIGRGKDADIMVDSTALSRMHARFAVSGNQLSIEDLGSKNGTFINGQRIDNKHDLVKGDKLKFGNVECKYSVPGAPAAVKAAPVSIPAAGPSRAARGGNRRTKEMIKNAIILAVLGIAALIGFNYYKNYESPELKAARLTIADIKDQIKDIEISDDLEVNADQLLNLQNWQSELQAFAPEIKAVLLEADSLEKEIADIITEFEEHNRDLAFSAEALAAYDAVAARIQAGMAPAEALAELDRIRNAYPGTIAAQKSAVKREDVLKTATTEEENRVTQAVQEAMGLAAEHEYSRAMDIITSARQYQYLYIEPAQINRLQTAQDEIQKAAVEYFTQFADSRISKAETGDCGMLADEIAKEYNRLGLADLDPICEKAIAKIETIRLARIAQARQQMQKELKQAEELASKRMYAESAALYQTLIDKVTEEELKNELLTQMRTQTIAAAGKTAIMKLHKRKGSIEVSGMGTITAMRPDKVDLEDEGVRLPLGWDKIRDAEYMALLFKAIDSSFEPLAALAYTLMMMDNGRIAEADKWLNRIKNSSPQTVAAFPDVFQAAADRKAARDAEAARIKAEKEEAERQRKAAEAKKSALAINGWNPTGLSGGGAMYTPAISPADPDRMMINCDMSGCYVTRDGGKHWRLVHHRQKTSNTRCKPAFHPTNPDIIYAPFGRSGIAITTDGGDTWKQHGTTPAELDGELVVDLDNPQLMIAGAANGVMLSNSEGKTWSMCPGISGMGKGAYIDRASPVQQRIILAATSNGIWRSDDGGKSWNEKTNGLPNKNVQWFDGGADPLRKLTMIYCSVEGRATGGEYTGGIYRSRDRGETWESAMGKGINKDITSADSYGEGSIAQYPAVLAADGHPMTVWALNRSTGFWPPHHPTAFRSDDAGETWKATLFLDPRFGSTYNVAPNYNTAMMGQSHQEGCEWAGISPVDPNYIIRVGGMRAFITANGGESWYNGHTYMAPQHTRASKESTFICNGLVVTSVWNYYVDPFKNNRHYIAYTDIGFAISTDAAKTWRWYDPDKYVRPTWRNTCYELAFDPEIPGKVWGAFTNVHDIPNGNIISGRHWSNNPESGEGGIAVSTDHCESWQDSASGLPNSPACSVIVDLRTPKNNRTLWAAIFGKGIYRSKDDGKTWELKNNGVGHPSNMRVCKVQMASDGTLYALVTARRGSIEGAFRGEGVGLFKSTDDGESWKNCTESLALMWPKDFTINPQDPNVIFMGVADGDNRQGGLYKSTDAGEHWNMVIRKGREHFGAFFHPQRPDWVYLTMAEGRVDCPLWLSTDGGSNWKAFDSFPFSNSQRVGFDPQDPDRIYVTTFGGSVFTGMASPE